MLKTLTSGLLACPLTIQAESCTLFIWCALLAGGEIGAAGVPLAWWWCPSLAPVEFLLGGWTLAPPGLSLLLSGSVTELPQAGNWAFPVLGLLFELRLQENGFGVGECDVLLWQDMKPLSRRRCGNFRSLKREA